MQAAPIPAFESTEDYVKVISSTSRWCTQGSSSSQPLIQGKRTWDLKYRVEHIGDHHETISHGGKLFPTVRNHVPPWDFLFA